MLTAGNGHACTCRQARQGKAGKAKELRCGGQRVPAAMTSPALQPWLTLSVLVSLWARHAEGGGQRVAGAVVGSSQRPNRGHHGSGADEEAVVALQACDGRPRVRAAAAAAVVQQACACVCAVQEHP